jgi:hypothetical protein
MSTRPMDTNERSAKVLVLFSKVFPEDLMCSLEKVQIIEKKFVRRTP